jgi:hypothetical protein
MRRLTREKRFVLLLSTNSPHSGAGERSLTPKSPLPPPPACRAGGDLPTSGAGDVATSSLAVWPSAVSLSARGRHFVADGEAVAAGDGGLCPALDDATDSSGARASGLLHSLSKSTLFAHSSASAHASGAASGAAMMGL